MVAAAFEASSNALLLSASTFNTKNLRREIPLSVWRQLQHGLDTGQIIQQGKNRGAVYFRDQLTDRLWRLGFKSTSTGEFYVSTLHRASERNIRSDLKRGRRSGWNRVRECAWQGP
ncbi:MAG TPA: hypothetical protein DCF62_14095 [Porticoccaceae bacterium]|nr:hypothetical protein [Porticoccaceae bacterium]